MLQGWCWWIAVWVVLKGLGEGSWDAAPLSGSRDLSSGWAHQSSLGKESSRISEIMELGIGKGDAVQGRVQPKQQGKREELGETENSPFPPVQEAHRAHRLPHLAFPGAGSAGRGAQGAAGARLGSCPYGCSDRHLLQGSDSPDGWGQAALWDRIRRVWLPEARLWNWLSHWLLPERLPRKAARKALPQPRDGHSCTGRLRRKNEVLSDAGP